MAYFNNMNGSSERPLVLYISVSSASSAGNDGRQKVYENLAVANAFPQLDFRTVRVNGNYIFDEIMSALLGQLTEADFRRLQMVVVNGFAQVQTGTLGGDSFTGAFFKVILMALLHRFPNNNNGHKIAVICSQCFSYMFVQQADSVPTRSTVYKFIALTNSYQPYLLHMDEMPRMDWVKWDARRFLEKLLVAPKLTCTSPTSPNSPSITMDR